LGQVDPDIISGVTNRPEPATQRPGRVAFWVFAGLCVLVAAVGLTIAASTARLFDVPSDSMANTIRPGDKIAVTDGAHVQRGDVIVEQQLSGVSAYFIRRVIGLPGDHVACCDAVGRITVNGFALNESYLYQGDRPSPFGKFAVTVPAGKLWLMGDHRSTALDSRQVGPLAVHVIGRVFVVFRRGHAIFVGTPRTFVTDGLTPGSEQIPPAVIGIALSVAATFLLLILLALGMIRLIIRRRRRTAGGTAPPGAADAPAAWQPGT
jgi:signal peptidase I